MLKDFILGAACCCSLLYAQAAAQERPVKSYPIDITSVEDRALVGLVRETLSAHPRISSVEAALVRSEALEEAAGRPVFNPRIGLDVTSGGPDERVLALSQTLDIAGRRSARSAVAGSARHVVEGQLAAARRDLAVELLSALAGYWTAFEQDALSALRVELMQRFASVAERRRRAGDLTRVDLNVANLAYSRARIERATAAAELAEAEHALAALTPQRHAGGWPRLPNALPTVRPGGDAPEELAAALPDVRIQRERVVAADAEVALRDLERRASPTLSLVGGEEGDEALIGLRFSMPLNVRNRYRYEVSAARAARDQAEHELEDVVIRARARLDAATQRYVLIREAWREWLETGLPNLSEQTNLLDRMWEAGELEVTEYLVQLEQTLDTQASALELQHRLWLAWFERLAAAGQVGTWLGLRIETP